MKLVYVAGPFSGGDDIEIEANIVAAERVGKPLVELGVMPVIPHSNGRAFKHIGEYQFWIDGTLELMRRCDAVLLTPDWERSSGARGEVATATKLRLPVFERIEQVKAWLAGHPWMP